MRKQENGKRTCTTEMIPPYGQQKLTRYAETFKELAEMMACEEDKPALYEVQRAEDEDRQRMFLKSMHRRNRSIFSEQLDEMAHIMDHVAKETYREIPMGERRFRMVYKALKQMHVEMKDMLRLENQDGHLEISIAARARGRESVAIEDMAGMLSVVLNERLLPDRTEKVFVSREYELYHFFEEPNFQVMTGSALAVKETERISGDNFCFYEKDDGHLLVLLSDGTGSGIEACDDSSQVLLLFRKLMDAGFSKEKAAQILNGSIHLQDEEQHMPTLDICDINLYSGELELLKIGASCTYIKRGRMIDRISGGNLPLGAWDHVEPRSVSRELLDSDYVIMLSDGIIDAAGRGMGEDVFAEFLGSITCTVPSEIANQILNYCIHQCKGQIKDDMTVLVIGLWERMK